MRRILLAVFCSVLLASCITNKQVQYLQKGDVNKKDLVKDSVVREYSRKPFEYKIQPNDLLSIRFNSLTSEEFDFFKKGNPQPQQTNATGPNALIIGDLVDDNGEVPFPVVGKVKVAGLNVFEIQDKLQQLADKYLESPVVKVRLLNYRVTVLGEVNVEGVVALSNNRVSVPEVIGLAGGLGELANRSSIKIIRQWEGKAQVYYIDLLDENLITSPHYYVYQNDIIIVPPLKQRPFRKYFGQNLALILSSISLLLLTYNIINTSNSSK